MKKIVALLLAVSFMLASVPAMAAETKYQSYFLNADVMLPDTLDVIAEFINDDNNSVYIHYYLVGTDKNIITTLTYVPEYVGQELSDLPKDEIEGWKEFFSNLYPKHSKSVVLKPSNGGSQRIYRYYGMNQDGTWMLSYTGVKDGLYVCVCCEAKRFGYYGFEMRAIFDAFNASFELFANSRGVEFQRFNPDNFEVEIFNLMYDDSPDSIFRSY
ncbi:MAG: hypothetical protein IK099_05480 [Clostridia bacterium]|nr:hypothetical protein [Clostridia bacterium]